MSMHAAPARAGTVSRALARDKLGVLAVLAFILASIAPMTVAAGVIPTAYALTGLVGIPAAFLVVAVVLALFCPGTWPCPGGSATRARSMPSPRPGSGR